MVHDELNSRKHVMLTNIFNTKHI